MVKARSRQNWAIGFLSGHPGLMGLAASAVACSAPFAYLVGPCIRVSKLVKIVQQ